MRPSSLPDPVAQGLLLSKSNETISPARRAAFEILRRVELENAYASVLLAALGKPMREDDRALCHELVLGVLRRRLWLDRALEHFAGRSIDQLDLPVTISLRLGFYQLRFLSRIPPPAAVNESVALMRVARLRSAGSFVNAVLRRATREPDYDPAAGVADADEKLALETSHPVWLIRRWIDAFGFAEAAAFAHQNNRAAPTAFRLTARARKQTRAEASIIAALKSAIKNELLSILRESEKAGVASEESVPNSILPYVIMVVGVNGVGKTTTIGKLAQRIKAEGNEVLICAADTFRAAASDQLAIWAERTGVPLIQQKQGTDPAAVLFDALKAAKARGSDVLIVDTAGRLHNKANLMAELEKMKRVAAREVEGAPHETLLILDAVTGQNGLEQARQFLKIAGVTGIVLTKLDGTAKGGIAVAIAKELSLPIRYAGIGEKVDDLVVFDPEQYVNGLFA